jgi:hypothetical protein
MSWVYAWFDEIRKKEWWWRDDDKLRDTQLRFLYRPRNVCVSRTLHSH